MRSSTLYSRALFITIILKRISIHLMRPISWLFLILLLIWLLTTTYCHSTMCNCGPIGAAGIVPVTEDTNPLRTISISDADKSFNTSLYDNLLFAQSDCMYESPISDSLNMVFQSLSDHLQTNNDRILLLTGQYQNAETNNCTGDDLGIARAESVRQLLVDKGVESNQIRLASSEESLVDLVDNKIMGGVAYSFINGDLTDVEQRLRESNITLYFDTNDENISLDSDQEQYFDDLKYLLSRNSDIKSLVTGHTDDQGSSSGNRRLSRKRAETVRDFMVDRGILLDQIVSEGKGPDEPIANNNTDEGRAQNRRVEITIQ